MKSKRPLLIKLAALVIVLAVAGVMFVVGRGHTVYFDNKAIEYQGQTYECPYKVTVYVKGEKVAKLYEKERGMSAWIGQDFKMTLEIMQEKNGTEVTKEYSVKLPYSMDGIVINLPAYLAGLPEDAYLTEFVSLIASEPEDEEIITDEFGIPAPDEQSVE